MAHLKTRPPVKNDRGKNTPISTGGREIINGDNPMTKVATVEPDTPTLDQRIALTLGSADQIASADLLVLIKEVDQAIVNSDATARVARKCSASLPQFAITHIAAV
jgi:cell division protein FtsX